MSCKAASGPRGSSFTRGIPTPFRDRGTRRDVDVAPALGARGLYSKPFGEKQSEHSGFDATHATRAALRSQRATIRCFVLDDATKSTTAAHRSRAMLVTRDATARASTRAGPVEACPIGISTGPWSDTQGAQGFGRRMT
jgi:hypothetical protein